MFVMDRYSGKIKKFVKSEKGNNGFNNNIIILEKVALLMEKQYCI
jgi:hypothetical protein